MGRGDSCQLSREEEIKSKVWTFLAIGLSTLMATCIELRLLRWFKHLLFFLDLVEIHNDLLVALLIFLVILLWICYRFIVNRCKLNISPIVCDFVWAISTFSSFLTLFLGELQIRAECAGDEGSGASSSKQPSFNLNVPPEEPARSFDLNRPGDEPGPSPEEELLYLKEEKVRLKQSFQRAVADFERLREVIDHSQESDPQSAPALKEKLTALYNNLQDLHRFQEQVYQLESTKFKAYRDGLEKELKAKYQGYENVQKWDLFLTNFSSFLADKERRTSNRYLDD